MSRYKKYGNYDLHPTIEIDVDVNEFIYEGWNTIWNKILSQKSSKGKLYIDLYQGVSRHEILESLKKFGYQGEIIHTEEAFKNQQDIEAMVFPDVTEDAVFGYLTRLQIDDYFNDDKRKEINIKIQKGKSSLVIGPGAALFADTDDESILLYFDMPRWEIQQRQRDGQVENLGLKNQGTSPKEQYKHSYFVDWRILDKHKQNHWDHWDWVVDTTLSYNPKMIRRATLFKALKQCISQPIRLVPFFDPGVWGGQWMKEAFSLDASVENYAWCFDCVPEENSLKFQIGETCFETPSINLVFAHPQELLGGHVYSRFGKEFPIRFDFLDTMGGQNLSLQVHPKTEYIREQFGIAYTQDESYYILDAEDDAVVYLGVKENVDKELMIADLKQAQKDPNKPFPAEKHINTFPCKKHDHFLIPAGTIHCSGANSMVLEISATPYIFTFKLWDWSRVDMDGQPRPINIEHGEKNIDWKRDTAWVQENLINRFDILQKDEKIKSKIEKTGLHEWEFIETRRYTFSTITEHDTGGCKQGGVHVLNLVDGEAVIVTSPTNDFNPFTVHYAETFIIPAFVGRYSIEPLQEGEICKILKAYVRG